MRRSTLSAGWQQVRRPRGEAPWASLPVWLPGFGSILSICGTLWKSLTRPPLCSTLESTSSEPSLGGNNTAPVRPKDCLSFRSTVLIVKVSRCSRSPLARLPPSLPCPPTPSLWSPAPSGNCPSKSALCSLSSRPSQSYLKLNCSR